MFENQGELLLLDSFDMNRDDEIEYIVANQDKVRTFLLHFCVSPCRFQIAILHKANSGALSLINLSDEEFFTEDDQVTMRMLSSLCFHMYIMDYNYDGYQDIVLPLKR